MKKNDKKTSKAKDNIVTLPLFDDDELNLDTETEYDKSGSDKHNCSNGLRGNDITVDSGVNGTKTRKKRHDATEPKPDGVGKEHNGIKGIHDENIRTAGKKRGKLKVDSADGKPDVPVSAENAPVCGKPCEKPAERKRDKRDNAEDDRRYDKGVESDRTEIQGRKRKEQVDKEYKCVRKRKDTRPLTNEIMPPYALHDKPLIVSGTDLVEIDVKGEKLQVSASSIRDNIYYQGLDSYFIVHKYVSSQKILDEINDNLKLKNKR